MGNAITAKEGSVMGGSKVEDVRSKQASYVGLNREEAE